MISKLYFKSFIKYWIPILKRDVFKYRLKNDVNGLLTIKENVWNNWNLTKKQRNYILKEIGLANI